jgi:hypothetical protein
MQTKVICANCGSSVPQMTTKVTEDKAMRELFLDFTSESNDNIALLNRIFPIGVKYHVEVVARVGNTVRIKPVLDVQPQEAPSPNDETPDKRKERAIMLNIPGADKMSDDQVREALVERSRLIGKGARGNEASKAAALAVAGKK